MGSLPSNELKGLSALRFFSNYMILPGSFVCFFPFGNCHNPGVSLSLVILDSVLIAQNWGNWRQENAKI